MAVDGRITKVKINDGSEKIYSVETPIPSYIGKSAEVTLRSDGWSTASGGLYRQLVDVIGMTQTIAPIIDIKVQGGWTPEEVAQKIELWSNVVSVESSTDSVYVYSYAPISEDVVIIVKF